MSVFDSIDSVFGADFANGPTVNPQYQPLQPKREWVGLTDQEIDAIYEQHHNQYAECISINFGYERAIEAKLKEKNSCNS